MTAGDPPRYFYNVKLHKVQTDDDKGPDKDLLGPYATENDALHALEKVKERNDAWEDEDRRWEGEAG